jgi:hypothetical protein
MKTLFHLLLMCQSPCFLAIVERKATCACSMNSFGAMSKFHLQAGIKVDVHHHFITKLRAKMEPYIFSKEWLSNMHIVKGGKLGLRVK